MKKIEFFNAKRSESPVQHGHVPHKMEVVTPGSLESISRPPSSHRSVSELSMSVRDSVSFELEVLPPEKQFFGDYTDNDLVVEEIGNSAEMDQNLDDTVTEDWKRSDKQNLSTPDGINVDSNFQEKAANQDGVDRYLADIDPKIARGLEKIKKLDRILAEKVRKEKEVKVERKLIHRNWQLEIQNILQEDGKSIAPNIKHLLALTAQDERSNNLEEDDADVTPVFATQIDMTSFANNMEQVPSNKKEAAKDEASANSNREPSSLQRKTSKDTSNIKVSSQSEKHLVDLEKKKESKKNFIKRNVELAGHANEAIALTDEERKRLDELLADDSDLLLSNIDNPFAKGTEIKVPVGYHFEENELKAIEEIDAKLKDLIPVNEYESMCFTPSLEKCSSHSGSTFDDSTAIDPVNLHHGEHALQEEKEFRGMKRRLNEIDNELMKLHKNDNDIEQSNTPRLSEDLLRKLLDTDLRSTSSALSRYDSVNDDLSSRRSPNVFSSVEMSKYDSESITVGTARSSLSEESNL